MWGRRGCATSQPSRGPDRAPLARRGVPIVYIAHVPVNLSFSQGDSVTLTMPFTEQHLLDALESLLDHESSNRIPTHGSAHEREESPSV